MAWFGPLLYVPSAVLTNPTDGTVIAASGALSRGQWLFGVAGSASVAIVFDLLLVTAALATRRRPGAGPSPPPSGGFRLTPARHRRLALIGLRETEPVGIDWR